MKTPMGFEVMEFDEAAFVVFRPDVLKRIPFVGPSKLSCRLDIVKFSIWFKMVLVGLLIVNLFGLVDIIGLLLVLVG